MAFPQVLSREFDQLRFTAAPAEPQDLVGRQGRAEYDAHPPPPRQ